jgi:hypothetical protein
MVARILTPSGASGRSAAAGPRPAPGHDLQPRAAANSASIQGRAAAFRSAAFDCRHA